MSCFQIDRALKKTSPLSVRAQRFAADFIVWLDSVLRDDVPDLVAVPPAPRIEPARCDVCGDTQYLYSKGLVPKGWSLYRFDGADSYCCERDVCRKTALWNLYLLRNKHMGARASASDGL